VFYVSVVLHVIVIGRAWLTADGEPIKELSD
jgi:hypothetical protein